LQKSLNILKIRDSSLTIVTSNQWRTQGGEREDPGLRREKKVLEEGTGEKDLQSKNVFITMVAQSPRKISAYATFSNYDLFDIEFFLNKKLKCLHN